MWLNLNHAIYILQCHFQIKAAFQIKPQHFQNQNNSLDSFYISNLDTGVLIKHSPQHRRAR